MSLKTWWRQKTGPAKFVTALAAMLIVQMGLCFVSPGEPVWFDRLLHIKTDPHQFRFGLVLLEFYLCIATVVLLVVAILVRITSSLGSKTLELSLKPGDADQQDYGDPND